MDRSPASIFSATCLLAAVAMLGLSSRSQHWIAKQSGHWVPLDEPAIVVAAVKEVLKEPGSVLRFP